MGVWIASAKDVVSGRLSWSPRKNLRMKKACGECGLRATDVDISVSGGYVRVSADVEAWTGFGEETTAIGRLMRPLAKEASGFRQDNTVKEEET